MGAGNQETPLAGIVVWLFIFMVVAVCLSGCVIIAKTVF